MAHATAGAVSLLPQRGTGLRLGSVLGCVQSLGLPSTTLTYSIMHLSPFALHGTIEIICRYGK